MIQVLYMGTKFYSVNCSQLNNDEIVDERIKTFIEEGTPVIFCDNIEDLTELGIFPEDITAVELE